MTTRLRLAITADLHWGIRAAGDAATLLMLDFLKADPPDVLVLAGDVGAGNEFGECLALFDELSCRKALVPGNHDIWVNDGDPRGDSLDVYRRHLPDLCGRHGFHYLDAEPLVLPESDLAVVGSINWYDYSWSLELLKKLVPDWEDRLQSKRFSRGRHNDARFVRWPLDDVRFTAEVVTTLDRHLGEALGQVAKAVVVTHHPTFFGVNWPRSEPPTLDGLLWEAFSGNRSLQEVLVRHADRIPFAFCGHTHRARENTLGPIRGYNVGGDYHFKRLLLLDWPAGTVQPHQFGNPDAA
jgi:3',5'-cyclic AMP phosphodiesterase CpdA